MFSSKYSVRPDPPIIALIAIAAALMLLLFFPQLIEPPHAQAVRDAVLHAVGVPSIEIPSKETRTDLNSILKGMARQPDEPIRLPFRKARDQSTKVVQFVYSITLDEKTLGANHVLLDKNVRHQDAPYGLLFIQIINGGDFYLNGRWVAGLARSTRAERWMWYEPFIVPLPSGLLKNDGTPNVLTVSQSTQKPYISIPRIYFGDIGELNMIYSIVQFFGTTLAGLFKLLCLLAGVFFLGIGMVSPKTRIYAVAGSACILWAALFMLFRLQQSPTDMLELWRWSLYVCVGGVIGLMTLFILSFVDRTPSRREKYGIFAVAGLAAFVYAVGGSATERYLDLFWSPAVILLYAYAVGLLIAYWWKTQSAPAGLFLLQSVLFMMLAFHDYSVQVGLIEKLSDSGLEAGWSGLFFEHIPILYLAIPFLLMAVGYMLLSRHQDNSVEVENLRLFLKQDEIDREEIRSKGEVISLFEATQNERDRIYQDLHNGIGYELVKAIFNLHGAGPEASAAVHKLQARLQEFLLEIDAKPESNVDTQTTVFGYCVMQEVRLEGCGVGISYDIGTEFTMYADQKVNLIVLSVLQESVNNTIKNSGATFIDIKLELGKFHLNLSITDNGHAQHSSELQSLEKEPLAGTSRNRRMTGLSLRAADIGAAYTVSITESGTKVRLSIPLPADMKMNDEQLSSSERGDKNRSHRSKARNDTALT